MKTHRAVAGRRGPAAFLALFAALAAAPAAAQSSAPTVSRPILSLEGAKLVAQAAVAEARRLDAPGGAIAVVDEGGHLIYLERLEGTFPAGARIAEAKARTAALFQRPTQVLEDAIVGGRATLLNVADAPLQGGVPISIGGVVVGAVGVSGAASAAQDTEIAVAAAAAIH